MVENLSLQSEHFGNQDVPIEASKFLVFMGKLLIRSSVQQTESFGKSKQPPLWGPLAWKKTKLLSQAITFTCRYIQTEVKIPFSETVGPSELPFPQGWERFWAADQLRS